MTEKEKRKNGTENPLIWTKRKEQKYKTPEKPSMIGHSCRKTTLYTNKERYFSLLV